METKSKLGQMRNWALGTLFHGRVITPLMFLTTTGLGIGAGLATGNKDIGVAVWFLTTALGFPAAITLSQKFGFKDARDILGERGKRLLEKYKKMDFRYRTAISMGVGTVLGAAAGAAATKWLGMNPSNILITTGLGFFAGALHQVGKD